MEETSEIDFFGNGLLSHCFYAEEELFYFKNFHTITEDAWAKKDNDLISHIGNYLKGFPKEQHEDIIEYNTYALHLNQKKYPSMHRESLVILIYNFLEDELNKLCNIISECIENKIKLKDLDGKGIHRAQNYLTKVGDFDFSKISQEWAYIKSVNLLRNQIVHSGGCLPEDPCHKLNKFISQESTLLGKPGGNIFLDPDFIGKLIDVLIKFFKKLDHEVKSFMESPPEKPSTLAMPPASPLK